MTPENLNVVCCFCGQGLEYKAAVEIGICLTVARDEVQGLYAHLNCLEAVLHKDIPLLWESTNKENN